MSTTLFSIDHTSRAMFEEDLHALSRELQGELLLPEFAGYEDARRIWNGVIDRRPAAIVRCYSVSDIVRTLHFARERGMPLSIRGGGHNVAGSAISDGGVVIDLSTMKQIEVNPSAKRVWVQPGVTIGELDSATQPFGLAVPMGVVSETGIGGLTLGGGIGWMRRKNGLSCDALRAVEVVTADGRIVRADATANSDLFWAVRGGGGNFGVVVQFEFELYDVGPEVFFLVVAYPESEAKEVLQRLREFMNDAPEAFSPIGVLGHVPAFPSLSADRHGEPCLILVGPYIGDAAEGREVLAPLRALGTPVFDFSGDTSYLEAQRFFDEDYPNGGRYYWKSSNLKHLGDEVIDLLIAKNRAASSSHSTIDIWFHGGAMGRMAPQATAYGDRSAPILIGVEANWSNGAADRENIDWARECIQAIEPHSDGSMYLNFPGIDEDNESRIRTTFRGNYARLQRVKSKYDPENVFKTHQNITPIEAVR